MASIYEVYVHGADAPSDLYELAAAYGVVPGPADAEGPCFRTIEIADTFRAVVRKIVPTTATVFICSHPAPIAQP